MKGRGKKHLHKTPAEFAEAAETRDFWWWQDHQERCERKNKQDSERIMPAHPKPKRQSVGHKYPYHGEYHESETAYRRRLKKWQARFEK